MKLKPLRLFFEAFCFCPLKCISCAQGRREYKASGKAFQPEMLERILVRISNQAPVESVDLFNLGEPLLNKRLPELVTISKRFAKSVCVSTTGNHWACDLAEFVQSNPTTIVISVSGFTEEIHQTTHAGGSIEKTKEFMRTLQRLGARNMALVFHRYKNNLHEEAALKRFAKEVGATFVPAWANHLHIEALQRGETNPFIFTPIKEQLEIARKQKDYVCYMRTNSLLFDDQGNLSSCSGSADTTTFGNVFEEPLETLIIRKATTNKLCKGCEATGAYKIHTPQNLIIDRENIRRAKAGPLTKAKWLIELARKHAWTRYKLRRVIHDVPGLEHLTRRN